MIYKTTTGQLEANVIRTTSQHVIIETILGKQEPEYQKETIGNFTYLDEWVEDNYDLIPSDNDTLMDKIIDLVKHAPDELEFPLIVAPNGDRIRLQTTMFYDIHGAKYFVVYNDTTGDLNLIRYDEEVDCDGMQVSCDLINDMDKFEALDLESEDNVKHINGNTDIYIDIDEYKEAMRFFLQDE